METISISKCCRVEANEDYKQDPRDKYEDIDIWVCSKCHKECEVEQVCALCLGTGEIVTSEQVYPGEPHMADIGTAVCPHIKLEKAENYEEDWSRG